MQEHYLTKNDFTVNPRKLGDYYSVLKSGHAIMDESSLKKAGFGVATMDAQIAAQSAYNMPILNQFLQSWLPGAVRMFTAPRRSEELMGFTQAGGFADETIVARFLEMFGFTQNYGDLADVPRAGYNIEYLTRQIVRFQGGIQTDRLESERMSKIGVSDIEEKRASLARSFAVTENLVAFNGFSGLKCYGFLNDPNLPAYVPVASTGSGSSPLWSTKTWDNKRLDILASVTALFTQTKTAFNPRTEAFTWAVPTAVSIGLTDINTYGLSLEDWTKQQFPNIRIIPIPELDGAASTLNA